MSRIQSLTLDNFRGYHGEHTLDLDADLILVTGKNGAGKTSLSLALEALLFGGLTMPLDDVRPRGESAGVLLANRKEQTPLSLSHDVWTREKDPRLDLFSKACFFYQHDLELKVDNAISLLAPSGISPDATKAAIRNAPSGLKERRTTFLPAQMDIEATRRGRAQAFADALNTLATLPFPEAKTFESWNFVIRGGNLAKHWETQLENLLSAVQRLLEQPMGENENATMRLDALGDGLLALASRYAVQKVEGAEQARYLGLVARLQGIPRESHVHIVTDGQNIPAFPPFLAPSGTLPLYTNPSAHQESQNLLNQQQQAQQVQIAALQQQQAELRTLLEGEHSLLGLLAYLQDALPRWQQNALLQAAPELTRLREWVNGSANAAPHLHTTLKTWATQQHEALERQLQEQRAHDNLFRQWQLGLDISAALEGRFATEPLSVASLLGQLNSHIVQENKELQRIPQQFTHCATLAQQWATSERQIAEELARLEKMGDLQAGLKVFEDAEKILKREQGNDGLTSLIELIPEHTRLALVETLNRLLVRFHFPAEFLPVRILDTRKTARSKPSWELVVGKWDTPLKASALSTGQKTQLAMCWCIGLNYALRNEMPQRLMVFDDFTTSLDMGQLIPAATLLRQLAYCEDEAYRRQVIVTSHHEDLTNKLLDYLLPPPGKTMKVIQMQEWREQTGPSRPHTFETAMPLQQWPAREELTRWLNAQTGH